MTRSLLAALVAAPLLAAPSPDGGQGVPYFPTATGARRVTELALQEGPVEDIEVVTKVEREGGVCRVSVERGRPGKESTTTVYQVSAAGVDIVSKVGPDGKPVPVFRPGKEGDTWTAPVFGPKGPLGDARSTATLGKVEEVTVPAGTFRAVRVDTVYPTAPPVKLTTWHAPGVGVVKAINRSGDGTEQTSMLKSFTPGK